MALTYPSPQDHLSCSWQYHVSVSQYDVTSLKNDTPKSNTESPCQHEEHQEDIASKQLFCLGACRCHCCIVQSAEAHMGKETNPSSR